MPAVHGKNTYVAFDDAAGNLTPLSTYLKEASADKSYDTAESSTFQQPQGAKTYVLGMNDETVSISGNFDAALHEHMQGLMNALNDGTIDSCTVVIGPAGNATGKVRTERECLVTAYNWSASTGDVVTASIEFQRTGPSNDGVFA
ncbi:major tail protein [Microbacterium phage ValentiniPuff]|uniref:Major tail protein n=1 Tax=Microbacterium phage ValentiniPuff TaxID=2315705 RepID=A0A386KQ53_9CAUD|nr:major tail protein [Microbacterium phage ValentiniPuff]